MKKDAYIQAVDAVFFQGFTDFKMGAGPDPSKYPPEFSGAYTTGYDLPAVQSLIRSSVTKTASDGYDDGFSKAQMRGPTTPTQVVLDDKGKTDFQTVYINGYTAGLYEASAAPPGPTGPTGPTGATGPSPTGATGPGPTGTGPAGPVAEDNTVLILGTLGAVAAALGVGYAIYRSKAGPAGPGRPALASANPTSRYDQREYKHYLIFKDKIMSGWEYKDDAEDEKKDLSRASIHGVTVVSKATLETMGIDPGNDLNWIDGMRESEVKGNPSRKHNQKDYEYWVVINNKIVTGNEYREDANAFRKDLDEPWKAKAKVYARAGLRSIGIDPDLNSNWGEPEAWHLSKSQRQEQIEELLREAGYDPEDAKILMDEGMGPFEVADRIRVGHTGLGSLAHTHGFKRISKANPAKTVNPGHVWLQAIGWVPGKPAGQLQVGDRMLWNYGYKSTVQSIEKISPQFVTVTELLEDGHTFDRRMKTDRLVAMAKR